MVVALLLAGASARAQAPTPSTSGLPTGEFQFIGFLPEKAGARRSRLEALAAEAASSQTTRTLIFYEAPHRILGTLADLEAVWGPDLRVVVARELTKIHEEFLRSTVADARRELAARDRIRGEITLLIEVPAQTSSSAGGPGAGSPGAANAHESITARVARMTAEGGIDEKEALKRLARELGQSKSEVYRELQRERAKRR